MSRLPTPAMSGGFIIKDKPDGDAFTLPPAALSNASRRSSRSDPSYAPASPTSPELSGRRSSHTARSGTSIKRPLEDFDLPPPPTRTRKIIQMKPKSPSKTRTRENVKGSQSSEDAMPPTSNSKRKQPSATSAAGRKIARKTAHSLIERRRRSKMNEEFGTLKDMIPACTGQEMHKLAILQASIDYVNYLEKCIRDMKTGGFTHTPAAPPSPTSPEFIAETGEPPMRRDSSSAYSYSTSASPELRAAPTEFPDTSPSFSPRTQVPSANIPQDASSILPSPALGPIWASNEKMQEFQGVDHEASAALLMLTQDRRGTADSISENFPGSTALALSVEETPAAPADIPRRKGMSVRDLLIS
ncbi:Helix-loop-helix DNA-binding [Penicillium roqueforti FM164]|uniref:Helix-loop-helix DNA-binding n=1 Tax=Penicillium roqueforti (strain FM164) TaxID=1365484 RepID=W6Q3L6_PENRF|nr:Helix-loop-helix DNA-binding [Penicillium roqueforti FM164]